MKMSSVVFRPYRRGDDIEINHAFNEIFGQQRSVEEWQWKFMPFADGSRIILAIDRSANDRIVAQYSVTTVACQYNGRIIRVGQPVDVFSYRLPHLVHGQIFVKAIQALFDRYGNERHCNVLFGFPGKRAYRLGRLAGLYPLMLPVPYFFKPVELLTNGAKDFGDHQLVDSWNPEDFDDLWRRACSRYPVSAIRTFSYIDRRFLSRPKHSYRLLACYHQGRLAAWAVFQITGSACYLVDLLWDGCRKEALLLLESKIMDCCIAEGVSMIEMWLSNDSQAVSVLTNSGWAQSVQPQELVMGANSFDDSVSAVEFMSRMYFTMADSDLF